MNGQLSEKNIAEIDQILLSHMLNYSNEGFAYHEIITNDCLEPTDYKYLYINNAFKKLTGLTNDIIGKTVKEIIPNIEEVWIKKYGEVAINGGSVVFDRYIRELDKHYSVKAYQVDKYRFAVLFIDITDTLNDRKRLKNAMELVDKANKSRMQFLKDINHRLRTPLNGMMGMSQLLDVSNFTDENMEFYDAMCQEMEHSKNIINQISRYIEIQHSDTIVTQNNIRTNITNIIDKFDEISKKRIILNYGNNFKEELYYVTLLFSEVLEELVSNALKYSEKNVVIDICNEDNDLEEVQYISLSVKDYGVGIVASKLDIIFNELYHHYFIHIYKPDNNITLSMCKQMVENINGELLVKSEVGVGTNFTLRIPAFY